MQERTSPTSKLRQTESHGWPALACTAALLTAAASRCQRNGYRHLGIVAQTSAAGLTGRSSYHWEASSG
jgi:hypothetical protein